jgi:hypothetical protein
MLRLAIALSFTLPLAVAAAGQRASISGAYDSNWDDVTLSQDGDRVFGTYVCCGGGTITGRIFEGRTIRYQWKQPGGEGMGVWTIRGDKLLGTWGVGQDDDNGGRWYLTRTSQVAQ